MDLDLGYSNHLALQQLMSYVTGAHMDCERGTLEVPGEGGVAGRFAVLSPHLYHTNFTVVHFPVFFQMCRAHHIGYDPKVRPSLSPSRLSLVWLLPQPSSPSLPIILLVRQSPLMVGDLFPRREWGHCLPWLMPSRGSTWA